jgi:hypothetical protein
LDSLGASVDGLGLATNSMVGTVCAKMCKAIASGHYREHRFATIKTAARSMSNIMRTNTLNHDDEDMGTHAFLTTSELIRRAKKAPSENHVGLVLVRLSRIVFRAHEKESESFIKLMEHMLLGERGSKGLLSGGVNDLAQTASTVYDFWFGVMPEDARTACDADANFSCTLPLVSDRVRFQRALHRLLPGSTSITLDALQLLRKCVLKPSTV